MKNCCDDASKVAPVKLSYPRYEYDEYYTMWAEDLRMVAKGVLAMILITLLSLIGILAFVIN